MYDIELRQVAKKYKGSETDAVSGITLDIRKGTIVTLLGPSGCGKTTILRLIAGFERTDTGGIAVAGQVVDDRKTWVAPEARDVGMVFQDYALFPHMTVAGNIGFALKGRNKQQRIREVMRLVDLAGLENRYPHELSGGQQQRVALARALAKNPAVILLDEPFSNLDTDLRTVMIDELKRIISQAGITAVFVSHDQKDAMTISDQIVVIRDGIIQQSGTPREIYQFPDNVFVATFVGQTNILDGIMGADDNSIITEIGTLPCMHTHSVQAGEKVCVSVRPESFVVSRDGRMSGKVVRLSYTGKTIDATVDLTLPDRKTRNLHISAHPEELIGIGDLVRFNVIPDFVAVINCRYLRQSSRPAASLHN